MGEETVSCPKCGCDDLIDWGSDRRMCRRCHEVFSAREVREGKKQVGVFESRMPQVRETYLDPREEADEDTELRGGLSIAMESEKKLEERLADYSPDKARTSEPVPDLKATHEFEKLHAERKQVLEQERREREVSRESVARSTTASRYPPQQTEQQAAAQKKKKARAAVGWVIFFVMIWVIMTIICSVREC